MAIKQALYFSYDGRTSEEMGLYNVNVGNGLYDESYLPQKKIIEEKIRNNPKPYFMGVEYEPLTIPVSFWFKDHFDWNKLGQVARWLNQDTYKVLQFFDGFNLSPETYYYALPVDSSSLFHNGAGNGYFTVNFRCNAPWGYNPWTSSNHYLENNSVGGTNIVIENLGGMTKPTIEVEIVTGSTFSVFNTQGGQKLEFTGLSVGEILKINCEKEWIETDVPDTYRYDNMTSDSKFLEFWYGNNYLNIKGNVIITFNWSSPSLV